MNAPTIASELPRAKKACYVVGLAGALVAVFAIAMLVGVSLRDRDRPQFLYELVISACAAVYFTGVGVHAVRAARSTDSESELPLTLRYLSQSVIALFVP